MVGIGGGCTMRVGEVGMNVTFPLGDGSVTVMLDTERMDVRVARSADAEGRAVGGQWEDVVAAAMDRPIGGETIAHQDLRGKSVVVITDDWGRPTPASRVVPLILESLARAGADDGAITFVTASGMHDPMSREDLARKLGDDVVAQYRCISHDGGDWEMLRFAGVSAMGTPVWVNRHVLEADYRVGLGRVALHVTHGYEGGYKLILPGVSGFDTILRDHSFNYAASSVPGIHDNPSRAETDAVGQMVGLDFLINVVVNRRDEPVKAFAGAVEAVYRQAVAYGDHKVWGAPVGHLVDITLASPGKQPELRLDGETVRRACEVTKVGGTVIVMGDSSWNTLPDWRAGAHVDDDRALEVLDREAFGAALHDLAFSELMRLHERRDWPLSPREIQWRAKSIRGEFYRRRWLMAAEQRRVVFTRDPQTALEAALARHRGRPRVLALPEAQATLPKLYLESAAR